MNLRLTLILSAALLFLSAPAWGNSISVKGQPHANAITFHQGAFNSHSNIKFLGGFKSEESKHYGFFNIKKGTFKLYVPAIDVEQPTDNDNENPGGPVSTPEPAALSLLLVGFLGLGALAYRRAPAMVGAQ